MPQSGPNLPTSTARSSSGSVNQMLVLFVAIWRACALWVEVVALEPSRVIGPRCRGGDREDAVRVSEKDPVDHAVDVEPVPQRLAHPFVGEPRRVRGSFVEA